MRYMLIAALLVGCSDSSSAPDAAIDAQFAACSTEPWFTRIYGASAPTNCYGAEQCLLQSNYAIGDRTCFIGGKDSQCIALTGAYTGTCCEPKKEGVISMSVRTCD